MNKLKYLLIFLLSISSINTALSQGEDAVVEEDRTLLNQYEELIEKSNSFEQYKVIKKSSLEEFKTVIKDSMQIAITKLAKAQSKIKEQEKELQILEENLQESNEERDEANMEKASISFLGMQMEKSTYKSLMWGIIFLLSIALLFFIYKFFESNKITVEARRELKETQEEMDMQRKTHIKKEQKIMRELQDEINKNLK